MAMLPSAVASTGPATHRAPGRVGGELVQQPVARSAADDAGSRRSGVPVSSSSDFEHDAVLEGEALENRARVARRDSAAPAGRSAGSSSAMAAGHVGRMEEAAVVGIEQRSERVRARRRRRPSARRSRRSCPARAQPRRHDCSSHSPPMFFSSRVVPPTPPSLVKLSVARARRDDRRAPISVPSSDHVPELRNARRAAAATDATADPVSWQAGATTGVPASAAQTDALQRAEHRARLDERRQQPRRDVELAQQLGRPGSRRARRPSASSSRWCTRRGARRSASSSGCRGWCRTAAAASISRGVARHAANS